MDQMTLIKGRFQKSDAENLITDVMRAKILFHENRINTSEQSEENLKHSEKRIKELEGNLREMTAMIRSAENGMFDIEANIKISTVASR